LAVINNNRGGFPRFKGKGWFDSLTYPQLAFG
jgi:hypothetical protein